MTTSVDLDSSAIKMAQSRVGPQKHPSLPQKFYSPLRGLCTQKQKEFEEKFYLGNFEIVIFFKVFCRKTFQRNEHVIFIVI